MPAPQQGYPQSRYNERYVLSFVLNLQLFLDRTTTIMTAVIKKDAILVISISHRLKIADNRHKTITTIPHKINVILSPVLIRMHANSTMRLNATLCLLIGQRRKQKPFGTRWITFDKLKVQKLLCGCCFLVAIFRNGQLKLLRNNNLLDNVLLNLTKTDKNLKTRLVNF
jgi:hypothetical protein